MKLRIDMLGIMGRIFLAAAVLFLLFPVFIIIGISFSGSEFLTFPPTEISLRWYKHVFSHRSWTGATLLSLWIAICSTLIAIVVGTLAAVAIVRRPSFLTRSISMVSFGPQLVPHIILALGILLLVGRLGVYGQPWVLVLAHATMALPLVVIIVASAVKQTGDSLERAARILGASPTQAFWLVTLPAIRPAVLSSAVFAFFVSFDDLIVALFIMGGRETLPMMIWANLRYELTPALTAVASALIVFTFACVIPAEYYRRGRMLAASK
jgi:ABC-type spermidine/putrescine transport system permease subunit II